MSIRKTTIRFESHSLSIVRPTGAAVHLWCANCRAEVPMVTPERAAELNGLSPRQIYRLVEAGSLDFTESNTGQLFICTESLTHLGPVFDKSTIRQIK